jgi:hypothetical protein
MSTTNDKEILYSKAIRNFKKDASGLWDVDIDDSIVTHTPDVRVGKEGNGKRVIFYYFGDRDQDFIRAIIVYCSDMGEGECKDGTYEIPRVNLEEMFAAVDDIVDWMFNFTHSVYKSKTKSVRMSK